MLTEFIEHLELDEVPKHLSDPQGVKVTIFYKHRGLAGTETVTAELFVSERQVAKAKSLGVNESHFITITDYFYEIGKILGLEVEHPNGQTPTVDWVLMKEIPDDHPAYGWEGHAAISQKRLAPGRIFWRADGFRWPENDST